VPAVAIQAVGVSKWFGEGPTRTQAVKDVSFEARFNEMLYIVGPSGSGKTTLLSMLSGILRPSSGTVRVEDVDIWTLDVDQIAEFRDHGLRYLVLGNAGAIQPSLTKSAATTAPYIKVARALRKL